MHPYAQIHGLRKKNIYIYIYANLGMACWYCKAPHGRSGSFGIEGLVVRWGIPLLFLVFNCVAAACSARVCCIFSRNSG